MWSTVPSVERSLRRISPSAVLARLWGRIHVEERDRAPRKQALRRRGGGRRRVRRLTEPDHDRLGRAVAVELGERRDDAVDHPAQQTGKVEGLEGDALARARGGIVHEPEVVGKGSELAILGAVVEDGRLGVGAAQGAEADQGEEEGDGERGSQPHG